MPISLHIISLSLLLIGFLHPNHTWVKSYLPPGSEQSVKVVGFNKFYTRQYSQPNYYYLYKKKGKIYLILI